MNAIQLIKTLIEAESISGSEQKMQVCIEKLIKFYGFISYKVGENIVVSISGIDKSKALIFNAHVDTVPAGDFTQWKYNPYKATVVGDKVYGLGASDEKAAVAVLLMLAEKYAKEKPPCDIFLTFVVREE